jgi:hypothetical protein
VLLLELIAAMLLAARAHAAPSILFLVDQSGDMASTCVGGSACFDTVRNALDPVLSGFQGQARFGLALFTGDGGAMCPALSTVPFALNNRTSILNMMISSSPDGEKPLADAINASVSMFANTASPRAIIAVFRGDPDTCVQPDPNTGFSPAIAAATNAFNHGIQVIVVSVNGSSPAFLQNLANAGAGLPLGGPTNAQYYVAPDPAQMNSVFGITVANLVLSSSRP